MRTLVGHFASSDVAASAISGYVKKQKAKNKKKSS
jgi:hypothetical protein